MFGYYLELAFRNLRRNPGLTALMIGAVALGIAVCVMTLTMYRAMSGNPIWWKNDVLYAVTMDFWDPEQPAWDDKPHLPPEQLTYRDAMAVYRSDIPKRKVIMHKAVGILSVDGSQVKPERVTTRVTTKDFFAMFDVPMQYGGTWTDSADSGPAPVMVISRKMNEKFFGGANSVAGGSAGTTTSSASWACATTGCPCRPSTTSTMAVSRSPRTPTSRSAGTWRRSFRAPATR